MSLLKARPVFKITLSFLSILAFLGLEGCTTRLQKPAPVVAPVAVKTPKMTVNPAENFQKIGVLLPLSGPHRNLGKSLQNAAELSFFEKGHAGMELVIEDTLGTPEGARLATQKALDKGVDLIIGPLFSAGTLESAKLATPRHVTVLSFTNDKTVAGPYTFVMGFDPQEQIDRVLSYARKKGRKDLVAFVPKNAYGALVDETLRQQEKRGVVKIVHLESYDPQNPSTLSRKNFPQADLLFIAEGGHSLSRIVSTLLYHENTLDTYQFIGTGQWDTASVRGNHSLVGAWFASPDPRSRQDFENIFQQTYGYLPPRLATLAYDAISMVSVLSQRFPKTPFSHESLTQKMGFLGLDGIFRLRSGGTVQRGLAILGVHLNGFQVIDAMPKKF